MHNRSYILQTSIIIIVLIGIVAGMLWLLVPVPAGADQATLHAPLYLPLMLADSVIAVGAGVLFRRAAASSKPAYAALYKFVAAAEICGGLLTLVFPINEYYRLWDTNMWFDMASYLAYFAGSLLMFIGMRKVAQAINGRVGRLLGMKTALFAVLAVWIIHICTHHTVWGTFTEWQYDLFEIMVVMPVVLYLCAFAACMRLCHLSQGVYVGVFAWLSAGLGMQLIGSATVLVLEKYGYGNWFYTNHLFTLLLIAGDGCLLVAAYRANTPRLRM